MAKLGKRTNAARANFAGKSNLSVEEAVTLIKKNAKAKFDETVDISINLGVDLDMLTKWSVELLVCQMELEKR